ncbi:hypothetical protein TrLO_g7859 [Triparma laevis f. longispina]|uniref:Uncharacterized protein n=1 Tax=Triparma laevis f. longispina TaxID=1714387 RepID=A0A9W6ZU37_9STRA|nr:hypothetical protein TrLO_g7859 [Triparma laevis f. longispina]
MSSIGVAVKISLTLAMGYMDVITDFLVPKSYYNAGRLNTAYATAGFALFAIIVQAGITFFQYSRKSNKERFGRVFLALLGFAPLLEGVSVWMGREDSDVICKGPVMYAGMKGCEIAFEAIPESIIQIGGLLKQGYGDIKMIQIIGVVSSVVSGAFIMTDGNFGPEVFAGKLIWRLLTNGSIIYVAMGKLGDEHYLDMSTGMLGYGISLGLAAAGFAMFYKNCDENFDHSTSYRPETGKKYIKEWFSSSHANNVKLSNKDEERW